MVSAEDAIGICQRLLAGSVQVWLTGGWGIDALLREETRPHKDLDIIILLDDVVHARELLGRDGYCLKELWSENRSAKDSRGVETATAFVLRDSVGREIDVHAVRFDDQRNAIPAWTNDEGLFFWREDLSGEGEIAGFAVHCISAKMQVVCHTGYDVPEVQLRDLKLLRERFGLSYPEGSSQLGESGDQAGRRGNAETPGEA